MNSPISLVELLSLGPVLVLGGGAVLLMLLIAASRHHRATAQFTTLIFLLGLLAVWHAPESGVITPLLSFDDYARAVQGLMIGAGVILTLLLYGYVSHLPVPKEEVYLLLVMAVLGAAILGGARHAAALLLGLEIMTVSLFGLVGYARDNTAGLEATVKYLVLSAAASATLLFGMALLYAASGSLLFVDWMAATGLQLPWVGAGVALLLIGMGFKLSLVPLHLWTPDVYQGAPAPVTALLSAVSKAAVIAVLLRIVLAQPLPGIMPGVLMLLVLISIVAGNLLALLSDNVKRLLAYSSIAQVGYVLVPLLVGGALVREAVLFNLVAYVVTTLGAFGVVSLLSAAHLPERDAENFDDFRGLFWRRPWLTSVLTPMLLSLAGVPLTIGFVAKFYVLAVAIEAQAWVPVAIVVLGSAIGLYYYLRLTITMFLAPPGGRPAREGVLSELTFTGGLALAATFVAVFWLGMWPQPLLAWLAGI